jgi:hypothetical protein
MMRSLWKALAIAWLGGTASPALLEEARPVEFFIEEAAGEPERVERGEALPAERPEGPA